jgi:hypothetical protein
MNHNQKLCDNGYKNGNPEFQTVNNGYEKGNPEFQPVPDTIISNADVKFGNRVKTETPERYTENDMMEGPYSSASIVALAAANIASHILGLHPAQMHPTATSAPLGATDEQTRNPVLHVEQENDGAKMASDNDNNECAYEPLPPQHKKSRIEKEPVGLMTTSNDVNEDAKDDDDYHSSTPMHRDANHSTQPCTNTRISNDKVRRLFRNVSVVTLTKKRITSKGHAVQRVLNKLFLGEMSWRSRTLRLPEEVFDFLPQV